MNEKKLKFQIALFSNQSAVAPNPENIKRCIDHFMPKGLMPSSVQELDGATGTSAARLSMQSLGEGIVINFLSNRLDIIKQVGFPGVSSCGDLEQFLSRAGELVNEVVGLFSLSFNRASLVVEYMFDNISPEQFELIQRRFIPDPVLVGSQGIVEWDVRFVERNATCKASAEAVNIVTSIGRHLLQIANASGFTQTEALMLQVDINSLSELTEDRFSLEKRNLFYQDVRELHEAVRTSVMGKIDG